MSMRQIQDLTLNVNRGLALVDKRFNAIAAQFKTFAAVKDAAPSFMGVTSLRRYSLRVTCVPLEECSVNHVFGVEAIQPQQREFKVVTKKGSAPISILPPPYQAYNWAPVLRGTEGRGADGKERTRIQLYSDGVVNYGFVCDVEPPKPEETLFLNPSTFFTHPAWLFGMIVNASEAADRFRAAAGMSGIEYAVEVEIENSHQLAVMRTHGNSDAGRLAPGNLLFPRYSLGQRETWEQSFVVMWRDFWNSIGVPESEAVFQIVD